MELQLALDLISLPEALDVVKAAGDFIDILELGTPFLFENSLGCVHRFRELVPKAKILADLKIMDAGDKMAALAFRAGCDVVTVSARTWDDTIRQAIEAGRAFDGQVMVDLMAVPEEEIAARAALMDSFGPDYICVHRAVFVPGSDAEAPLRLVRETVSGAKVAVAGGIGRESLGQLLPCRPDLAVVGAAITGSPDPRGEAAALKKLMTR